jgi:hypothetical protein
MKFWVLCKKGKFVQRRWTRLRADDLGSARPAKLITKCQCVEETFDTDLRGGSDRLRVSPDGTVSVARWGSHC